MNFFVNRNKITIYQSKIIHLKDKVSVLYRNSVGVQSVWLLVFDLFLLRFWLTTFRKNIWLLLNNNIPKLR